MSNDTIQKVIAEMRRAAGFTAEAGEILTAWADRLEALAPAQAVKADIATRYASLLPQSARGKMRITLAVRDDIIGMHKEGMAQAAIARLLRISPSAVNQIIKGVYPGNRLLNGQPLSVAEQALERVVERERKSLLDE